MRKKFLTEVIPLLEDQIHPLKIHVSEHITKEFALKAGQKVELICSRNSVNVEIVSINEKEPVIYCSSDVLQRLKIPTAPMSLTLFHNSGNILEFGPVIGLLTDVQTKNDPISFGSIEGYCKELASFAHDLGVFFYVFSLDTFEEQSGYVYMDGIWKKANIPYPHVVHNRIHSRKREQSIIFKDFIQELQQNKVPFFNDHFLNKWEVHEILMENEHLHFFLPDTRLLTSKDTLFDMLEKYGCIFVKPVHGSQGKNIFRIKKTNDQTFFLDYTAFTGEIESEYQGFAALFQALRSRFKQQTFIIQECIPLLSYKGNSLDFRILCQKHGDSKWQITSMVARVSSKDQFVSNIARGGEIKNVNDVLSESFEVQEVYQIKKLMKELSLEVASIIDLSTEGIYAELGIDLAIDQTGKPTIIEINTKPSKNLDADKTLSKIRPSAKAILYHCIYLANSTR